MKTVFGHKWAVGLSALVLVFALGTIAWAAGDTSDGPTSTATADTPDLGARMFGFGGDGDGDFGLGRMGRRGAPRGEMTEEMQAQMEERRAAMEARRDAFLDLVREQMSAEDQAKLDSLLSTAETQRDALEAARDALHDTTSQIRDLVDEYFPATSAQGTTGATSSDTGGEAASATGIGI